LSNKLVMINILTACTQRLRNSVIIKCDKLYYKSNRSLAVVNIILRRETAGPLQSDGTGWFPVSRGPSSLFSSFSPRTISFAEIRKSRITALYHCGDPCRATGRSYRHMTWRNKIFFIEINIITLYNNISCAAMV